MPNKNSKPEVVQVVDASAVLGSAMNPDAPFDSHVFVGVLLENYPRASPDLCALMVREVEGYRRHAERVAIEGETRTTRQGTEVPTTPYRMRQAASRSIFKILTELTRAHKIAAKREKAPAAPGSLEARKAMVLEAYMSGWQTFRLLPAKDRALLDFGISPE